MEVTKTGRFVTDYYGSQPAVGAPEVLRGWIENTADKSLLSWGEQIKKKGETAPQAIEKILSIFNRDNDGYPIIGNWMIQRCLVTTGFAIFNAMKNTSHPKRSAIE